MSLINQMLQELDRREAGAAGDAVQRHVHAVGREPAHREWFWRTLALLIFAALAWVAWVAYQMWPHPIVTELAYRSAEEARARAARPPSVTVAPSATPPVLDPVTTPAAAGAPRPPTIRAAAEATPAVPEGVPAASQAALPPVQALLPPVDRGLRLAKSIDTPIVQVPRKPAAQPTVPKMASLKPAEAADLSKVERRDRVSTPADRAENEFRYAAAVLKLGRAEEAESHFAKALEIDPRHHGARQALVVMDLEQGDLNSAQRLLEEGLRLDPAQPEFAMALARIRIERKDLAGALSALDGAAAGAGSAPDFNILRGTVLQRLGRNADAAEAYRLALRQQPAIPQAWVGLGISLEALQRHHEAAEAFRQALLAGPVNPDLKAFIDQRIRALR